MFSYLDFRCYFKGNAQTHIHSPPRDLGESLRIIRRSAFTVYHTFHQSIFYSPYLIPSPQSVVRSPQSMFYTDRHNFIRTHNLLHYYKVGDQASVKVEGVEEQMLIFSSSLTLGRVKGCWIVLIWKSPACLKFGKTFDHNRALAHD